MRKALPYFLKREKFRIWPGEPALDLRHLLICQLARACVLLFHQLDYAGDISLPLRRPYQHPIEDFLHLVSRHSDSLP